MKQAILITAYKDVEQLMLLIDQFDNDFNFYIHIDKKSSIQKEQLARLQQIENVQYISQDFKINWGGLNHLKAYLHLSEIALKEVENEVFHLITGQDYPLKSKVEFKKFFHDNKHLNFMEFDKMPTSNWKDGGMYRLEHYNFHDYINAKTYLGNRLHPRTYKIQKWLNIKRPIRFNLQCYGGSTYWTLSKMVLQYVIDFTNKNPSFLNRFRFSFCAEEIYFQTIIMNSEHAKNVVDNNLRLIDWESGKGGYPAFFDENDFEKLIESNKFFARKIDLNQTKLIAMLNQHKNK